MKTNTSTIRKQGRVLPAVSGKVAVLKAVGSVNENTGEIAINGKAYFCRCLEHCYQLFSFDARKNATTNYDLPADLSSCECLDYLSRSDRREDNKCKHQKAIAALVNAGRLPKLECNPIPRVTDLANADYLDADTFDETEVWCRQYDAV